MSKKPHIETQLLHAAAAPDANNGSTATPIYQSSAFAYESAEEMARVFEGTAPGYIYTRINNPTLSQFEQRMSALEGALGGISCSSGMAAITATVLAAAESGDEIISSISLFGGTYSLFRDTLKRMGIIVHFVDTTQPEAFRQAITDKTKLIFIETMGNPRLDIPDIQNIADIAHEHGIALAVDNTLTTPLLIRPADFGADIVIYSTSKYINGHGNSIGGIVLDTGKFDWTGPRYEHLSDLRGRLGKFAYLAFLRTKIYRDLGCCFSPFNAFLMTIGIESLAVRMDRHCSTAMSVARFIEQHHEIQEARYSGLESHEAHDLATSQFNGRYGALLTMRLGTAERAMAFLNALKQVKIVANLGDARTLAIHPASTFCREFSKEQQESLGVYEDLVRMSIGLEHPDDILADIDQALTSL
jgi:O-acetylhomoserine (thiol)-lyase